MDKQKQNRTSDINETRRQVLIIGAGPAGLTAALELLRNTDALPIVLEASDSVGGISRTENHKGNRMDLGGHRFFTHSQEIRHIWQEILPLQGHPSLDDRLLAREQDWTTNGPDPAETDRVMLIRNRVSRIFFANHFFDYPITLRLNTILNLGLFRTFRVVWGYTASVLRKRPEHSLEDFYINRFGRPLYEMFFEDYTEKLWGVHPSKIAPDWGAQRVKGLSLSKAILTVLMKPFRKNGKIETSLIESFHYPKLGPGQLWSVMADEVIKLGGQIITDAQVSKISCRLPETTQVVQDANKSRYQVEAVSPDGVHRSFNIDTIMSSMAIKDLVTALDPLPPDDILQASVSLPYRDFITVGVLANRLKIHNQTNLKALGELVPDSWIYIQERSVKLGRLQIFNNWSPYLVVDPINTAWIGLEYFCSEGDPLWSMSDDDFKEFAVRELEKIGVLDQGDVLDQAIFRVRKAYPAYFGSYSQFPSIREYLKNLPGLYCIGRNGQHRYNNMDHSMLTAIEAVRCFRGLSDQDTLWGVNAEATYGG